ncbi:nicotinate phosphoribosyltransferase [Hydrogenivirga caldilitoris]|uniref:Nicotinate phosphoribosyltransferase n=1 Tax=Hydrogenivirga caldilitoris TaxID=246264 RepID=A0A497XPL3_9AQUI|nr:nicotinate phosphoribosyltransferase [Hydrogenivirga caldilitoris]RLJ70946.1 nicotinate phosphoribosyltransferase [Hydrogenivirga caldilitoris]
MEKLGLCTDLYELTMAQSYLEHGKTGNAVFSLFVRKLPEARNFLVSCGLETLLEQLERFRFGDEELKYLKNLGRFSTDFLDYLRDYEFRGNIYAIPEGRIFFQNEPIVQFEGSLPEVQILETLVINIIHFQTVIASKAVRSFLVSRGKALVDFGFRRAHGLEAGIYAARASYISGFAGTSNLEAGRRFGIPVFGTVAHSYIMIFDREEEAFKAFAESFPKNAVFLLDTYDTIEAAKKTVQLARKGVPVVGVRLDSGDIEYLSKEVRRILDEGGLKEVKIIVSGGVDEYRIDKWLSKGCPIDAFGVGTKFITSADAPYLDMAYKLVEYEGKPKVKTSPGKATFPFKRQVYRFYGEKGMERDEVVIYGEEAEGESLVDKVIEGGSLKIKLPSLNEIRERMMEDIERLPPELKSLEKHDYRVIIK